MGDTNLKRKTCLNSKNIILIIQEHLSSCRSRSWNVLELNTNSRRFAAKKAEMFTHITEKEPRIPAVRVPVGTRPIYRGWPKLLWGGGDRFSDRPISQKKLFGIRIWRIFYTYLLILLIQRIADLSNILVRIVNLACNLVRIVDCDFIVEIFADSNLDKTIVGSRILLQIWADRRICIPLFTPPPVIAHSTAAPTEKSINVQSKFCT